MTGTYRAATVVARDHDGAGLGWVELEGENIGQDVRSGQFAMLVRPGEPVGSKGRPYAYFRPQGPHRVRFLTRERPGQGPSLLSAPDGSQVPLCGPLGRPFKASAQRIWAVAGGVGVAAFGSLVTPDQIARGLELFLGVRGAAEAHLVQVLQQLQPGAHALGMRPVLPLHVCSDDGSLGLRGTVVDGLAQALRAADAATLPAMIYACGPAGVLESVAALTRAYGIACEVSVNVALPCGVGTCGGCGHTGAGGRRLMACMDGPTYPADVLYG